MKFKIILEHCRLFELVLVLDRAQYAWFFVRIRNRSIGVQLRWPNKCSLSSPKRFISQVRLAVSNRSSASKHARILQVHSILRHSRASSWAIQPTSWLPSKYSPQHRTGSKWIPSKEWWNQVARCWWKWCYNQSLGLMGRRQSTDIWIETDKCSWSSLLWWKATKPRSMSMKS